MNKIVEEKNEFIFDVKNTWEDGSTEEWEATIKRFKDYGHSFEMYVCGYGSGLTIVFCEYSSGWCVFMPDYNTGAKLARLDDTFYNTESILESIKNVKDAVVIAKALSVIAKEKELLGERSLAYQKSLSFKKIMEESKK